MIIRVDYIEACMLKRACVEMTMNGIYQEKAEKWEALYNELQRQIDQWDEAHGGRE